MASDYPDALHELIHSFARLPGIGKRTAERLAIAVLDWEEADLALFGQQLQELKERIRPCQSCGNLADQEQCQICRSPLREKSTLCIVETARQIPVIEKCGRYRGLYHVLGGKLSPLEGIDEEALNIPSLHTRIQELEVTEIILATSPDVEGEATATFIAGEIADYPDLTISRIALGIPVGADLSFADAATMAMAIDSRRRV